jgi:hypothetical protein
LDSVFKELSQHEDDEIGRCRPRRACSRYQAATDFTLLSCAQLLVYMGGAMVSGMVADAVGYANLFAIGTPLSLAGIMLAMRQIPPDHPGFKVS